MVVDYVVLFSEVLPLVSLELPEMFIEHFDEEKVELGGVGFVGGHEIGVDADGEYRFECELEDAHILDVFKSGVDGHVEIMRILCVDLLEFLIELFVFFAFGDDIGFGVGGMFEGLQEEVHQ